MDFNPYLLESQEDRWENILFESKPRHVTPQIECFGKTIPVLRVSTHIYGVPKGIDGKMFIFLGNLGMSPLKLIISEKWALFWGFQHTFMGFPRSEMENVCFQNKPRHVTPQIECLGKLSPVLRVSTHIYGNSKRIDGKTCILRVNLGMWPLKSIISENWAMFWGFQHTFMGFPRK